MTESNFLKVRPCLFTFNYIFVWILFSLHLNKMISDIKIEPVFFIVILLIITLNIALILLIIQYILYSLFYDIFISLYELKIKQKKQKKFENEINVKEIEDSTIICCICLENIESGIKLKCSHYLHAVCFEELINNQFKHCPLCIQNIV